MKNDQFIKDRVERLFPDENFYFYQIRESKDEMVKELAQAEKFIKDTIASPRFYVKSGEIEAVHLKKSESAILMKNVKHMLDQSTSEVHKSHKSFIKQTGSGSQLLME